MTGQIDLVVCDMAGTTVRDAGQVPQAFMSALAAHGIAVTPQAINSLRGASKRLAILNLIPEGSERAARSKQVYATFVQHLAQAFHGTVEPVPRARETIDTLRSRGLRIALNTGFDRETTDLLLDALRWREGVVDAVVCGDEVAQGRPAPYMIFRCMEATGVTDVRRVANAGDTVLDLQAGYHAGVALNIGVLSGAHGRDQMQPHPHTHLLDSVADLPELLARR
ncbi:MAG: phosphonatase-like hydrolase [Betaproteobacteria bacterium]|nr:phosphonatase-like hydrolase [Betaproteobacteria bacterium]MDH4292600.1 phosphonatase-like hydrolase [Betaproteobacteria bacterium]MDH5341254.1 phosphonatase-like hydrolase [Betaproteobacteria bacterium]